MAGGARPYYLPVLGPPGSRLLDREAVLGALRPILTDPAIEKVGQNVKYDMLVLGHAGIALGRSDHRHDGPELPAGKRRAEPQPRPARAPPARPRDDPDHRADRQGEEPASRWTRSRSPRSPKYAGEDADATWRIEAILAPKVRAEGLWNLYADLERPLIAVLARMETAGVKVDVERLRHLSVEFAGKLATIEEEIYHEAGHRFNIGSLPQLRQVLFEELKLPSTKKTPGGEQSTDSEVLEELAAQAPAPSPDHRASPACQAQEHVSRCPARPG